VGAYFDHNATTPLDPRVRAAMLPWLGERFGNASSAHRWGQAAREAVEGARERVAALVGAASPLEVLFTASGTEANNAVVADALARGGHFVVSALEHPSVLGPLEPSRAPRAQVARIAPDRRGRIDAGRMIEALGDDTVLAALMLANNEIGTLQPVAEVAAACRARGIPLLCDAVQAVGKVAVDVQELGVDYLTVGAHKFHGPLGAAALWIRPGAPFTPFLVGGSQERRRRASTANVPALVGFGVACELAGAELTERAGRLAALRDRFEAALAEASPGVVVHGAGAPRLPHTSSVAFPGTVNQELMIRLDLEGWAVSIGSACASGHVEPSPVLRAMGVPGDLAIGTLRISFGTTNDASEVDAFVPVLARAARELAAAPAPR
jgi:cysteine desulfurase